ncbi:MAG: CcmD family protein [Acidobacteriota bacterium]
MLMDFLEKNQLYIAMLVVLINWVGILFYLFRLDSKITKLEKTQR